MKASTAYRKQPLIGRSVYPDKQARAVHVPDEKNRITCLSCTKTKCKGKCIDVC